MASPRRCLSPSTLATGMAGRGETCLDGRGRARVATRVATRRGLRRRLRSSRTTPQTDARVSVHDPQSPGCVGATQRRDQAFDDGIQILTAGPVVYPQHDQAARLAWREPHRVGEVEVECHQGAARSHRCVDQGTIRLAGQCLVHHGVHIVASLTQTNPCSPAHVLVELQTHATSTNRPFVSLAPYARQARTSDSDNEG